MRFLLTTIISAVLVLSLTACAGNSLQLPQVSDTTLKNVKQEGEARKDVFLIQERKGNEKYVKRIANRLLKNIRPFCDHTGYEACFFQVVYNKSRTLNATASENKVITIYKGLIEFLETDDEVAAVIAHEMAHHLLSHNKKTQKNALMGSLLAGAIVAAANANDPYYDPASDPLVNDYMNTGAMVGALSYSREEEREADLLGAYILSRAGYSLKKAERVLWLLYSMNKADGSNDDRSSFGDSHPAGPERIAAWRETIKEIKANKTKLPYKVEKILNK